MEVHEPSCGYVYLKMPRDYMTPRRPIWMNMVTSSNGNIFRVIGPLSGECTGHRWIPLTRACDAALWCFLWFAPEHTVEWFGWWFETPSCPLWSHCNEMVQCSYTLSREYRVVRYRYSRLLFTSEDRLFANLRVQEQSTNMTSQWQCPTFVWRHRSTLVTSQY